MKTTFIDNTCEQCKYFYCKEDEYPCKECQHSYTNHFKKQSNRDAITHMTNEEFVEWLLNDYEKMKFAFTDPRNGLLQWLKEEEQ